MQVFFGGAEIPELDSVLDERGVLTRALSFRRIHERPSLHYVRPGIRYWVDHGLENVGEDVDREFLDPLLDHYISFVQTNSDSIVGALEFDVLPMDMRLEVLDRLYDTIPGHVVPVWRSEDGVEGLKALGEATDRLVVVGNGLHRDKPAMTVLQALSASGVELHVHQVPNPENVVRLGPVSVSTTTWTSPMRYGEILLPEGAGIHRHQPPHSPQTLAKAAEFAKRCGIDPQGVIDGDSTAWMHVAVESLRRVGDVLVTNSGVSVPGSPAETPKSAADNSSAEVRKSEGARLDVLPGLTAGLVVHEEEDEDGRSVVQDVPVLGVSEVSVRRCDTCVLAMACPGYVPGNHCAYKLPVEMRTKTQVKHMVDTLMEIQTQRVAFARFTEEVRGGEINPEVGKEMDRLVKMIETRHELEQQVESISINVESRQNGGILSALFGSRASAAAELPGGGLNEIQTDQVLREAVEPPS